LRLIPGLAPEITDWLIGHYVVGEWQPRAYAASYLGALGVAGFAVPAIAFLHEFSGGFALMFLLLGATAAVVCAAAMWLPTGRMLKAAVQPPARPSVY
jgi:hypothetical protein